MAAVVLGAARVELKPARADGTRAKVERTTGSG